MHGERRIFSAMRREEGEGEQEAALALLEALEALPIRETQERLSVDSPVALFIGAEDRASERVHEARKAIHRARFVSIPNQDHIGLFTQREALLAEVLRLAQSGKRNGETSPGGKSGPRNGRNSGRRDYPAAPLRSTPAPRPGTDESVEASATPGDRQSIPDLESSLVQQEAARQEDPPRDKTPPEDTPSSAALRHDPPEAHQEPGDLLENFDPIPGDAAEAGPGPSPEASLDTPGEDTRDASSSPEKSSDDGGAIPEAGKG